MVVGVEKFTEIKCQKGKFRINLNFFNIYEILNYFVKGEVVQDNI